MQAAFPKFFLSIVLIAYMWLTRQSFYKSITSTLEQYREVGDPDEHTALVVYDRRNPSTEPNSHVYQVFRQNLIFMFPIVCICSHYSKCPPIYCIFSATDTAFNQVVFPTITACVRSMNLGVHPLLFTAGYERRRSYWAI